MPSPANLLLAVILTWAVEWSACLLIFRRFSRADGFALLLINAFTNPLANAAYNLGDVPFFVVEAVVILAEVPLLRLLVVPRWTQAVALSLVANGLSASLSWLF